MDFTKFVALLDSERLFFPRLSALQDQFEGMLTKPTFEKLTRIPDNLSPDERERRQRAIQQSVNTFRMARHIFFISSWHMNEHESAAMWRLYLKSNEGVAVTSTFNRLRESVAADNAHAVSIGVVNYIDYDSDEIDWQNAFNYAFHKRQSFAHEWELRGAIMDGQYEGNGIAVSVKLDTLIENVHVAPGSAPWFRDLVQAMVGRFGLDRTVRDSALDRSPLY